MRDSAISRAQHDTADSLGLAHAAMYAWSSVATANTLCSANDSSLRCAVNTLTSSTNPLKAFRTFAVSIALSLLHKRGEARKRSLET